MLEVVADNHVLPVQLLRSLERASLVTEEKTMGQTKSPLRCTFTEGKLALSSVSVSGRFYDEIPVEHEGDDIVIAFNNRYLIDSVRSCDTDEVELQMSTPLTSVNILPVYGEGEEAESNDIFFLLPVRMKS